MILYVEHILYFIPTKATWSLGSLQPMTICLDVLQPLPLAFRAPFQGGTNPTSMGVTKSGPKRWVYSWLMMVNRGSLWLVLVKVTKIAWNHWRVVNPTCPGKCVYHTHISPGGAPQTVTWFHIHPRTAAGPAGPGVASEDLDVRDFGDAHANAAGRKGVMVGGVGQGISDREGEVKLRQMTRAMCWTTQVGNPLISGEALQLCYAAHMLWLHEWLLKQAQPWAAFFSVDHGEWP